MKKTVLLFSLILLILSACNESDSALISSIVNINKEHKSLQFKVTEKYYYSNGQDTTITPFEIWVTRDKSDTLRNGYVWVNNNYRPYNMIYDAGNFYLAIPPKKTTVVYENYTEDFISSADWINVFLNPEILQEQFSDSSIITSIFDEIIYEGEPCYKLVLKFSENKDLENKTLTYIVDKKNAVPLWAMFELKTKDYIYYDELFFSDYTFNKVKINELKELQKQVLTENPVEDKGTNSELSRMERMLHIGDAAPMFKGKFYKTDETFKLDDYIGKNVIIVDFWYTHCPPCVRAMPYLSELNTTFKDKGLKIFGLNSVDNQEHSLKNLSKFLKKRQTSYDIIMTQPAVDIMYKINGYPTMYIIDKKGNIAFVEVGFDEDKFEKLKEKVEELLNE